MSGIFTGNLFGDASLGQDASFDTMISDLARPSTTGGAKTAPTGPAYIPGTPTADKSGGAAYIPSGPPTTFDPSMYPATPPSNTGLYVVGGVVAVAALGAMFMMSGSKRKPVTANRRKRRQR